LTDKKELSEWFDW